MELKGYKVEMKIHKDTTHAFLILLDLEPCNFLMISGAYNVILGL